MKLPKNLLTNLSKEEQGTLLLKAMSVHDNEMASRLVSSIERESASVLPSEVLSLVEFTRALTLITLIDVLQLAERTKWNRHSRDLLSSVVAHEILNSHRESFGRDFKDGETQESVQEDLLQLISPSEKLTNIVGNLESSANKAAGEARMAWISYDEALQRAAGINGREAITIFAEPYLDYVNEALLEAGVGAETEEDGPQIEERIEELLGLWDEFSKQD